MGDAETDIDVHRPVALLDGRVKAAQGLLPEPESLGGFGQQEAVRGNGHPVQPVRIGARNGLPFDPVFLQGVVRQEGQRLDHRLGVLAQQQGFEQHDFLGGGAVLRQKVSADSRGDRQDGAGVCSLDVAVDEGKPLGDMVTLTHDCKDRLVGDVRERLIQRIHLRHVHGLDLLRRQRQAVEGQSGQLSVQVFAQGQEFSEFHSESFVKGWRRTFVYF